MNRKRSFYILLAALGVLILVLAACNPLLTAPAPSAALGSTSPAPGTGGISIGVQPFSPVLMELVLKMEGQASYEALSPKAFLGASKVVFQVYKQPDNVHVSTWEAYPTQNGPGNDGWNLGAWYGTPDEVYPYVLHAYVYNQVGDLMPSVQGSAEFWINYVDQSPGSNRVTVTCTPSNPYDLTEGMPSAPTFLPITWNWNDGYMTVGSEKWYRVTPSTSLTAFTAAPAPGSYAHLNMTVYDSNGYHVGGTWAEDDGAVLSIPMCSTTPFTVYYIGLVDWQYSSASNREFTVSAGPATLPAATPIGTGSWIPDDLLPGDVKVYSFYGESGKTYAINWDDVARGSGSESADIMVSALKPDKTPIFINADSGWSGSYSYNWGYRNEYPVNDTMEIGGGGDTVNIVVAGSSSGSSGTFRIRVAEYSFAVGFEDYLTGGTDSLVANGWAFDVAGSPSNGAVQVLYDPTYSGYGNVLELNDQNENAFDPGIALYTPFVSALQSANLSSLPTTISLDFFLEGNIGRWFALAKTYAEVFVMNDPESTIDAYANGTHQYMGVNRYTWYRLLIRINETPGTYDVFLYNRWGNYLYGYRTGLAFNAENRDLSHFGTGTGDGRLFFGSLFDDVTGDTSYGHVFIDNIRVLQ